MRILVTGATGFLGSHLVETLIGSRHTVTCLVRKTSNLKYLEGLEYERREASLDDPEALRAAVMGQEAIVHCAALVRATNKDQFFKVNAEGTRNLAQAATDAAPELKRFLLVSSQAAIGPSPNGVVVDETTAPNPIDTYGKSKLQGEREVQKFADRLPITIVRPSAIYGPRDQDIFQIFQAVHLHVRPVVGMGRRMLSLCHVSDVIQVITRALDHEGAIGETYLASTDRPATWREVTSTFAQAMGTWAVLVPVPPPVLHVYAAWNEWIAKWTGKARTFNRDKARVMLEVGWTCDISKAKNELGYHPRIDLLHGAETTYRWYRENGWL